jgi:hypothetical protein
MSNSQPSTDLNILLQTQRTLHDRTIAAQIADIEHLRSQIILHSQTFLNSLQRARNTLSRNKLILRKAVSRISIRRITTLTRQTLTTTSDYSLFTTPTPPPTPPPTNPRIRMQAPREPSTLCQFITPTYIYYTQRRSQIDEYEAYCNDAPEEMDNILH